MRRLLEQADDGREEQVALGLGVRLPRAAGVSGTRRAERRHEPRELAAVALDVAASTSSGACST